MTSLTVPKLNRTQRHILQTLFDEGGLNTRLIERYVVPARSRREVGKELARLRDEGHLIQSVPLTAEENSEYCWVLTYDGARALNRVVVNTEARYRAPSLAQLEHKAVTLRLVGTLRNLNWEHVRPYPYNSTHPKPADTPQRLALVRAVEAHFARTAPGAGVPRLHPSQVPGGLNDWVAWPAEAPERALVVIVHPVGGTYHFWRTAKRRGGPRAVIPGRLQLYGTLAPILPVLGLFGGRALATAYRPLLQAGQVQAVAPEDLPALLHHHRLS
jgi:hypothetical protein